MGDIESTERQLRNTSGSAAAQVRSSGQYGSKDTSGHIATMYEGEEDYDEFRDRWYRIKEEAERASQANGSGKH